MLFGYPLAATQNNWIHDCLVKAVKNVHALIDANKRYPVWPKIIPDEYQAALKSRRGLRDRLKKYDIALRALPSRSDRDAILAALSEQNRIADLVSKACNCVSIGFLPQGIHTAVVELFDFAFELLSEIGIRDEQYQAIYHSVPAHVCPFCGTEHFDQPGAPREDLDHYLAKSRYPFAAANLRNLVPMGHKCNSKYKLAIDVLYDVNGDRRAAFDPYNHTKIGVVLDDSDPFDGTTPTLPKWAIKFEPDVPAIETWDAVFSIRERYGRDHLDAGYLGWLEEFQNWARSADQGGETDDRLIEALRRFEKFCTNNGMKDRAFLKAAVFRMLRLRCEQGHDRLKQLLRDLLRPLPPPIP